MTRSRDVSAVQNNLGVAIPPAAAGKNAIINGAFDIWQRGTSITTSGAYTADRWGQVSGVSATFSRSTDVPSNQGFTYSMSMAGTGPNLNQRIESLNAAVYAGQTITVSFWYKSTVGSDNLNIQLWYANTTDNFAGLTQIGSTQTISSPATSWTRYTYTYTNISANAINGLSLYIYRGNSATSTTLLTGVQLELGSSATPFSRAGGTIQGELAACQRYLPVLGGNYDSVLGFAYSITGSQFTVVFPTTARVAPTGITVQTLADWRVGNSGFTNGTPTAITWNAGGTHSATINATTTAGSPTIAQNNPVYLQSQTGTVILFTGCEL